MKRKELPLFSGQIKMDFFKPPTDNLYKFVAISGLVLLVAAIVFPQKYAHDIQQTVFDHNKEVLAFNVELDHFQLQLFQDERLGNIYATADPNDPKRPPPTTYFIELSNESDRRAYLQGLVNSRIAVTSLSIPLAPNDGRQLLLSDDTTKSMCQLAGLTEKEYRSLIEGYSDEQLQQSLDKWRAGAPDIAIKMAEHEANLVRIWYLSDIANSLFFWSYVGMSVGSVLMLVGFWCWYKKVQRYQDAALKHAATEHAKD